MQISSENFIASSRDALHDSNLQTAFARASSGFIGKRIKGINSISNFDELKQQGADIKQHTLDNLGYYLQQFEEKAISSGAQVHWAEDGEQLNQIVLDISQRHNAKLITKGKSMVSEETNLATELEAAGIRAVETDLGEYIIQLAKEKPSHIVAPAVHKTRAEITALFKKHHKLGERDISTPPQLVAEARLMLRRKYVEADIGITGANFLIAESGGMMLLTNEGNGDLTSGLPKVHIVTVGIEKVVPTINDAFLMMRLLTNSATGQRVTCYVSLLGGVRAPLNDTPLNTPLERHYILLDNGRSKIYNSKYREILKCIRCGACLNHCPVYTAIGGTAYGSVYPGPLGSVLTPLLADAHQAHHLPNASSLCGRCVEVCPVKIPLTDMLRDLREEQNERGESFNWWKSLVKIYMELAMHPRLYYVSMFVVKKFLRIALLVAAPKS